MTISKNLTKDWTENDWERFYHYIKILLEERTVKITFTKKDGSERIMNCTLNPKVLPLQESVQDKREKNKNKEYMAVYDTDLKEWRSFVVKNVKEFEFKLD